MALSKETQFEFVVFGINHRTASIDLRDQVYFNLSEIKEQSKLWVEKFSCKEILIMSTCNRTEIYVNISREKYHKISEAWRQYKEVSKEVFYEHLYTHKNSGAIQHLFKVCGALDSMILGENQILGQVKQAYEQAKNNKSVQSSFNQIFQTSFFVGKKIRSETELGRGALSIASASVELIKKIGGDKIFKKKIAIVGVGEMSNIICNSLKRDNCESFDFYNRTIEKAKSFSKPFSGNVFSLQDLHKKINEYDIIISATTSPNFILTKKDLKKHLSKKNLLVLIDIAAPRDIDSSCSDISNVLLFSIDDLKQIIVENQSSRKKEAIKAISLLEKEAEKLYEDLQFLPINSFVQDLKKEFDDSIKSTLLQLQKKYSQKEFLVLEKKIHALNGKIKHKSILDIKKNYLNLSNQNFKEIISHYKQDLSKYLKEIQ